MASKSAFSSYNHWSITMASQFHHAMSSRWNRWRSITTPSLLLLNPIPQTTQALSIMDSPFHQLWLVFLWSSVNISARCLSPCTAHFVPLIYLCIPMLTSMAGRRSLMKFNTSHRARFFFFFLYFFQGNAWCHVILQSWMGMVIKDYLLC